MRWGRRRDAEPRNAEGPEDAGEDLVTVEAGQVTLSGPRAQVRHAVSVGLYGQDANPMAMSKDEDHVMTGVYIGVGVLLAVGAGYLAWRYLLSDDQKNQAKDFVSDSVTKGKRVLRDTKGKLAA